MKKTLLILLIAITPLLSNSQTEEQTSITKNSSTTKSNTEKNIFTNPKVFFKKFESESTSNSKIFLYLIRNSDSQTPNKDENAISIVLDDTSRDIPISFSGLILPNGNFKCYDHAYSNYIPEIDSIVGKFLNDTTIRILLNKQNSMKEIVFTETQKTLTIFPSNYFDSYTGDKGCDDFLSYVNIDFLKFKSKNNNSMNTLNKIIDSYQTTAGGYTTYNWRFSIDQYDNNMVIIKVEGGDYSCGANHGDFFTDYINYDILNNKQIYITDLFSENSLSSVESICYEKIKKKYDKTDDDISLYSEFSLPKQYALFRKGILFQFLPYELGPYAEGALNVFIPFEELYELLQDNELTERIVSN